MRKMLNRLLAILLAAGVVMSPISAQAKDNSSKDSILESTNTSDEAASGAESSEDESSDAASETSSEEEIYVDKIENAEQAKQGVVQINCVYIDDEGISHIIVGGAGFLVGAPEDKDDTDFEQYVITSKYVMDVDSDLYKDALLSFGVDKEELKDNKEKKLSYEVVVAKGMTIEATLVNDSDDLDLAIFKLSENLPQKKCLTLCDDPEDKTKQFSYQVADKVYALGFPAGINYVENPRNYYKDDISVSSGEISNIRQYNNIWVVEHDADITDKNCGGPLVDGNGTVIGMNVLYSDGEYSFAISSREIIETLDALGISASKYVSIEASSEESSETDASTESTTIIDPPPLRFPLGLIIALVIVTALLIAMIITVIILVIGKDNKNKPKKPKKEKKPKNQPQSPTIDRFGMPVNQMQSQPRTPNAPIQPNANSFVKGIETTSLNSNKGDLGTSVLGATPVTPVTQVAMGTLIRKKNGENTVINKPVFVIGKDSLNIDFRIADNSAVSRRHAAILKTPNGIVIEDYHSTNGTYVNGIKVVPEQPVPIRSGDVIKLADEEFDYRV